MSTMEVQMYILLAFLFLLHLSDGTKGNQNNSTRFWDYSENAGPSNWDKLYHSCSGLQQSPINLFTDKTLQVPIEMINFFGYKTLIKQAFMENNGKTVQLLIKDPMQKLRGGGLSDTYKFLKIIFHWGENSSIGSEHVKNNHKYPFEMQWVHYNTRYEPEAALTKPDGLAILVVLFVIGTHFNQALNSITDTLNEIKEENSSAIIRNPFYLNHLLPDDKSYYRYRGSLSTPPCHESVVWTIFDSKLKISESQLMQFRYLKTKSGHNLVNNFRPVQPRNGRIVSFHKNILPFNNKNPFGIRDDNYIDIDIMLKNNHIYNGEYKTRGEYKYKAKDTGNNKLIITTLILFAAIASASTLVLLLAAIACASGCLNKSVRLYKLV